MQRLLKLLISLQMLTLLGCQTYQIHPFELGYVKPYSGDCHFKNVVTKETRDVKKVDCDLRKMLLIPIESANTVLSDLQINCHLQQCVEITGAGDEMLLSIDKGLQQIPW